jgi:pimeloyl-ACP methyl ester carboxylesterase
MLLVHGGACDHMAWYYVAPLLAKSFTVYSYDRRGRGESGDTPPYTAEKELEDMEALMKAIGEPVHLVGHSAGGILALLTTERGHALRSMTLYEPAFIVDGARKRPGPELVAKMESLLAAGDRAEVVRMAMRETLELPESEIAAMGAGPGWEQLLSVAHSIPCDFKLWDEPFVAERAQKVEARTLVLMGSESPEWLQTGTRAVKEALPNARLEVMQGQAHLATVTAPEMFAQAVIDFVNLSPLGSSEQG